jgi:hypothetical protein
MMTKRWRIECDAEGCQAAQVSTQKAKADAGLEFNDSGWQAGPGTPRAYCEEHRLSDEEWRSMLPALSLDPLGPL